MATQAAADGNATNAQLCEEGGYLDYTDADGTAFKNEGHCTRYAAQGGTLVAPRTVTISYYDIDVEWSNWCGYTVAVAGFAPSTYDLLLASNRWSGTAVYANALTVGADGTGRYHSHNPANYSGYVVDAGQTLTATADGVASGQLVVAC